MAWSNLGSIAMNDHEWGLLPGLGVSVGSNTFRLTHTWRDYPVRPVALMGMYFAHLDGIGAIRRVYPSRQPVIVELDVPAIIPPGEYVGDVMLRRTFPYDTTSQWVINVEVFY